MTSKRHILFLAEFFSPDICATAVVAADQLAQLADLRPDWQFTVIAGNRAWHDPALIYAPRDRVGRINIIRVSRPALGSRSLFARARGFAAYYFRAFAAARELAPVDLIIGSTAPPLGGRMARIIAGRLGCPFVYKVYDLYPDTAVTLGRLGNRSPLTRWWLSDDTRTMRRAAAVVCIASEIEQRARRLRDIDSARLYTIHDGYDPARLAGSRSLDAGIAESHHKEPIAQAIDAAQSRDSTGEAKPLTVQYAGNMGLSHPFDAILEAARRLTDDPNVRFQFIGDGPARSELATHLPPNAELLPFQPDDRFAALLRDADICLVTQHADLFDHALPYKVYAILAAAKPLLFVGNPRSEIAEWIRAADCGISIPQGDGRALADAITTLKSDPARRADMSRRARALFDKRFHVCNAAKQWSELLDRLLVTKPR